MVDDPDCIYRLSGHTLASTTEIYTGHLRRDGAMSRYSHDNSLFDLLATPSGSAKKAAQIWANSLRSQRGSAQRTKNRYIIQRLSLTLLEFPSDFKQLAEGMRFELTNEVDPH